MYKDEHSCIHILFLRLFFTKYVIQFYKHRFYIYIYPIEATYFIFQNEGGWIYGRLLTLINYTISQMLNLNDSTRFRNILYTLLHGILQALNKTNN